MSELFFFKRKLHLACPLALWEFYAACCILLPSPPLSWAKQCAVCAVSHSLWIPPQWLSSFLIKRWEKASRKWTPLQQGFNRFFSMHMVLPGTCLLSAAGVVLLFLFIWCGDGGSFNFSNPSMPFEKRVGEREEEEWGKRSQISSLHLRNGVITGGKIRGSQSLEFWLSWKHVSLRRDELCQQ